MSSQALEVLSALAELPVYLKRFIDTIYALAVAFVKFFNILEGSGLKKATTKAISRRLKSLNKGTHPFSPLPFTAHPDAHTASLPGKIPIIYADYAGAPPYSISAVKAATEELLNGVWGNPHSDTGWDSMTVAPNTATTAPVSSSSAAADRLRQLTLEMCHADPNEYVCILTSGATAALKLVAESFPWSNGKEKEENNSSDVGGGSSNSSRFVYLSDNHNSVLGIREVAALHGASTQCIQPSDIKISSCLEKKERIPLPPPPAAAENSFESETQHLFAFPLESNFSGTRYSENLVLAVQNQTLEFSSTCTTSVNNNLNNVSGEEEEKTVDKVEVNQNFKRGRWRVLIDAAKACATHPPNLSLYPADFVALSYYKIFGYPSGLGALLVRRDALCMLRKTYFGGGTVLSSSAEDRFHALRPGYAGFEDGTLPFLAFPAVLHSFSAWQHRGGFPAAEKIGHAAASQFAQKLLAMKHGNGSPVATVYGQWQSNLFNSSFSSQTTNSLTTNNYENNVVSGQGPMITFNLLDSSGNWVGHRQVQRIASLEGIYLRTGVMCNPGACSTATGVKAIQAKTWFENGHVCWDDQDVLDGVPTGAVRVSFGWGSSIDDADALAEFVHRHFVSSNSSFDVSQPEIKTDAAAAVAAAVGKDENSIENFNLENKKHDDLRIQSLTIYPIKSAAGFSPRSWPVSSSFGLLYDRHWAIVDAHGSILTLKKCPQLNILHPMVCLEDKVMRIYAKGMNKLPLEIPLPNIGLLNDEEEEKEDAGGAVGDKTTILISSGSSSFTSKWLTEVLGIPCSLIEYKYQNNDNNNLPAHVGAIKNHGVESKKKAKSHHHGFSNEAQILLVTVASLQAIYKKADIESSFEKFAERFRPNIIIEEKYLPSTVSPSLTDQGKDREDIFQKEDELLAFEEEEWTSISLHSGKNLDNILHSLGRNLDSSSRTGASIECDVVGCCPRCEMICIDPNTGLREGAEPLLTLAKERKGAGKRRFCFGVLLNVKSKSGSSDEQVNGSARMSRVAVGMHLDYETK